MAGLHLNHHIHWSELVECCYVYEDPGITLPVCECNLINASEKKVQHQIENRKYLDDKICSSKDCKIVGEKVFRKSDKKKSIEIPQYFDYPDKFKDKFVEVLKEFAETERKNVKKRNVIKSEEVKSQCKEIKKRIEYEGKWPEGYLCEDCALFSVLIENGEIETLLSFPNEHIEKILSCMHGGQAVGNNFRFLTYYVIQVYFCSNIIFAANIQDKSDCWGPMKPGSYSRGMLEYDCDGQTFLYEARKYLKNEVYMKDFEAMRELCKKCFQFLYLLEVLRMEVKHPYGTKDYFF